MPSKEAAKAPANETATDTAVGGISLTIGGTAVRQDDAGRFCLNDLHRAAGGEQKLRPNYWLGNQQTKDLISEIEIAGIPAITSRQKIGSFVCKELVYAYAMWISPSFHLQVIRAHDALVRPAGPALPDFSDPVAAARAWADAQEGRKAEAEKRLVIERKAEALATRIAEDRPKVAFFNKVADVVRLYLR